jgi:hypothetical protein
VRKIFDVQYATDFSGLLWLCSLPETSGYKWRHSYETGVLAAKLSDRKHRLTLNAKWKLQMCYVFTQVTFRSVGCQFRVLIWGTFSVLRILRTKADLKLNLNLMIPYKRPCYNPDLSPRRTEFHSRPICVEFVVERGEIIRIFLRVLRFSSSRHSLSSPYPLVHLSPKRR